MQGQQETILPYDIVTLPSQGIFYKNKKTSVKVTYLNASDENLLASPALQDSGDLVDTLLTRKILDKDILLTDMPECDKEAVLIFLRNTAFGTDYTIKLTDPKTKEEFSHTFDLSILKTKDIGVEIDGNNEFEFFLDISKKKVKLSFITPTDDKELKEIDKANKNNIVNPYMTKQLEKIVKEVDGVRDAMTIAQFIQTMPIRDSQNIRKVIRENTPAIDLNIIVNSPSNTEVGVRIAFGVEFFRPFYGI
jgi:hypothetical protein|tara:strand:- start:12974 stop:13720 length:747 start_codon:yes stop_codon:yes gene_type:complete